MTPSYTTHILDNGLTVLLQEIHSAPIISHWVWYRVGSRSEVPGKTGVSHWVEHMQFKGTAERPGEEMDRTIARNGGIWNAFTYMDWTAFFETLPADRIGIALDLEADRMVNSLFDPEEVESERSVILSEREGSENDPTFRLTESLRKTAFPHHPYGTEVIGETEDLERLTRDDLYEHYRTWYVPNNAVLTMAGDFDSDEILRRIEAAYGKIPARPVPELRIPPEEAIRGPLTVEEHGPCDITHLRMDWHAPGAADPDVFALTLLDSILAGPTSMNMFGRGGIANRTSRLYRKLVRSGMAAAIGGGFSPTVDPYLFSLSALVNPGTGTEEVREAVYEELESIAREGVLPAEIEKARKQARAIFAYSAENITNQAHWLGYSSMFADPTWYTGYLPRLDSVRAEDISRIAGTCFRRDNSVTGIYSAEEKQHEQ